MSDSRPASRFPDQGLRSWLSPDGPFAARLRGVFRFDAEVLAEIAADPRALGQALVVVAATGVLAGLGRLSPGLAFLGIATTIVAWAIATLLIWAAAVVALREDPDLGALLRVSGFAYAWNALQLGAGLPWIGALLAWAGLLCGLWALVIGARNVMGTTTARTAAICAAGLLLPLGIGWALGLR